MCKCFAHPKMPQGSGNPAVWSMSYVHQKLEPPAGTRRGAGAGAKRRDIPAHPPSALFDTLDVTADSRLKSRAGAKGRRLKLQLEYESVGKGGTAAATDAPPPRKRGKPNQTKAEGALVVVIQQPHQSSSWTSSSASSLAASFSASASAAGGGGRAGGERRAPRGQAARPSRRPHKVASSGAAAAQHIAGLFN